MYSHNFFTTCGRDIGPLPTTASKSAESFIGFIKAGFAFLGIILSLLIILITKTIITNQ
jgi:hypothetical protein